MSASLDVWQSVRLNIACFKLLIVSGLLSTIREEGEHRQSIQIHRPQKTAVLCTCVVPVWSGNELLRAQLPPSSQLYCPAEML